MIASFDQRWMLFPDVYAMYPDPDIYTICNECEIKSSDIVSISVPPPQFNLLKLDIISKELCPVNNHFKWKE